MPEDCEVYNPVYEAYTLLVKTRDYGEDLDLDEVIGYLAEALDY
jgi:hypothetical protein